MGKTIKPLPRNQSEVIQDQITPYLNQGKAISDTVFSENRGTDYSMKGDTVKDISIGLEDIDSAVLFYFNNVIKPTVIQNGQRVAVPVIYGSPERWKSVQNDGFYRDNNGKLMVPIIMFKRDAIEKNRSLGNKIDGNKVHNYQVVGTKFNKRNIYDNFAVLTNRIPSEQYYISSVPDYINITYSCIIFTDFIEQNNKLIEAIQFASDSYWGDPNRFKFRANIDSFNTPIVLEQGQDRAARSSFNIKMFGYIIPDTVNKDLATARSKFYTKAQIIFNLETVEGDIDKLNVSTKAVLATNSGVGSTSFIGGGNNVRNVTVATSELLFLNSNVSKNADSITAPDTAVFNNALFLQPLITSPLYPTSLKDFVFYINGMGVEREAIISFTEVNGNCILILNTTILGYSIDINDEITAVGKFIN
jgi:hypothetical protein